MCLHLGPAHVRRFVIIWRRNERLLGEHVSQTRSHPNDDKLALSPPLASQSSPNLDVMHALLLRTEMCGHRTRLSLHGGGPHLPVLNHRTFNFFFPIKGKKESAQSTFCGRSLYRDSVMDGESLLVSDPCSTRGRFQGDMMSASGAYLARDNLMEHFCTWS